MYNFEKVCDEEYVFVGGEMGYLNAIYSIRKTDIRKKIKNKRGGGGWLHLK